LPKHFSMRTIFALLSSLIILSSCSNQSKKVVANKTINVAIEGMTCAEGCAKHIEETIAEIPGMAQSKVNFDKKLALFSFDSTQVNTDAIISKIQSLNEGQYKANVVGAELPATEKDASSEEAVEFSKKEEAHS
jgi:copper chaperone CopZ